MRHQTGTKNYIREDKQTVNKGEKTAMKDRSKESRITSEDGNWTLSKRLLTREHEQRAKKTGGLCQQEERNAESAGLQHVEVLELSKQEKECASVKWYDMQCLPSEIRKVYSDYDLRNRLTIKIRENDEDDLSGRGKRKR